MSSTETITGTARFVKDAGLRGDAAVYELDPPYIEQPYSYDDEVKEPIEHKFVIVSAVDLPTVTAMFPGYRTSETYIFPSDGEGITNWGELAGIDYKSHADALAKFGYSL